MFRFCSNYNNRKEMKAIKYFAPEAYGAWAKIGYLFENGYFICEFKYYNKPYNICRKYDFKTPPEKITWGKDVVDYNSESSMSGAIADYQTFEIKENVEKDFSKMKSSIVERGVSFWSEKHHASEKLI